ncbi:cholinesterase 2-like [Nymphalis io]|uniref:cholinesterase 2-like n=1 Tax=Inachis io TaxID=171585 RepID=UPI0021691CAE|nr:cholinesterase 2-like [Nymphalis io]
MWATTWLVVLALGLTQGTLRLDPLVDTQQGLIRGLRADDGDYSMFLGIPYARVDEDNPFGKSTPHPKFDDIFEAYDDSAICPQVEEFGNTIVGSLDCLHLNVYVPNKASSRNKLPVLVWIYGGGFTIGFANRYLYGPKFLVQHDVILVTLNYRLGPYGFMCLDTPEVPGNQGLKDQLLGMRWVKENIGYFGGDTNKITLMGESAGAASVEYHLYSNQERLFNQAILQSGSALSPWALVESDPTVPLKIAERLGYQTEDLSEALAFLKGIDTKLVIAATSELDLGFRACVEKQFDDDEGFLTEHPQNVDVPKVRNMPVLSGFNSNEDLVNYAYKTADEYLSVFNNLLKTTFNYDDDFTAMEDIVRHFYIGDEEVSDEVKGSITDFSSDFRFTYPVQRSLKKFLENGAKDIFQYVFSYSGGRNFAKTIENVTGDGASHADEIGYLFDLSYDKATPSEDDQRIIDQMTTLWTNFVKYGNPTPETTELLPLKWIPITNETYNYLDIDKELSLKKRPFHDRLAFWELFYQVNEDKLKSHNGD